MVGLPLLLLPGLDGTGLLFRPLRAALPAGVVPVCAGLSQGGPQGYRALLREIHPPDVPYAVVGESFSGPLALMLADRDPNARAVILVGSFARSPSRALRWLWPLARSPLTRMELPDSLVRRYLLGEDAGPLDLTAFRMTGRFVEPRVMAGRLEAIAQADVRPELARCRAPVLYLRARRDRLVPHRVADAMREVNPRMEIEDVDAPHLLLQRAPEEAARRIAGFLRRSGLLEGT